MNNSKFILFTVKYLNKFLTLKGIYVYTKMILNIKYFYT